MSKGPVLEMALNLHIKKKRDFLPKEFGPKWWDMCLSLSVKSRTDTDASPILKSPYNIGYAGVFFERSVFVGLAIIYS